MLVSEKASPQKQIDKHGELVVEDRHALKELRRDRRKAIKAASNIPLPRNRRIRSPNS
jgi:hypothetical protein